MSHEIRLLPPAPLPTPSSEEQQRPEQQNKMNENQESMQVNQVQQQEPNLQNQQPLQQQSTQPVDNNVLQHQPEVQSPHTPQTSQDNSSYSNQSPTSNLATFYQPPSPQYSNYYIPVQPHWFYQKIVENREKWYPFSILDSSNLEQKWLEVNSAPPGTVNPFISTDGGRYDVNMVERRRHPIYWKEEPTLIRRCTWFYKKEGNGHYIPYSEEFAQQLEDHYRDTVWYNKWNQRIEFPGQEIIIMHSPTAIAHYKHDNTMPEDWTHMAENPVIPREVQRGTQGLSITLEDGEPPQIDHLIFLVHGVGEICDLRFRSIVEVVDDFRATAHSMMKTHFKDSVNQGRVGRVEFLPISWHEALHGESTGIDERLKLITLNSVPKLRHFTNDTILDALLFVQPLYCQTIIDTVSTEMNRIWALFRQRNPYFQGTVAVAGHSLGSQILFDILSHQKNGNAIQEVAPVPAPQFTQEQARSWKSSYNDSYFNLESVKDLNSLMSVLWIPHESIQALATMGINDLNAFLDAIAAEQERVMAIVNLLHPDVKAILIEMAAEHKIRKSYTQINRAGEMLQIRYPSLHFEPSCLFALGSPIAMFLTIRGIESLSPSFRLPTCPRFFNIFHPYDPIAYRIEPLVDPQMAKVKPVLIPHHKGRKRMHLELKESLARMGSDLKQALVYSVRRTWYSISGRLGYAPTSQEVEEEVNGIVNREKSVEAKEERDNGDMLSPSDGEKIIPELTEPDTEEEENNGNTSAKFYGLLNSGRRIDHVLQEKPIEVFNEYVFAFASHACYWESEDTALLMLKELYKLSGITPSLSGDQPSQPSSSVPNLSFYPSPGQNTPVQLYNPAARAPIPSPSFETPVPPQS